MEPEPQAAPAPASPAARRAVRPGARPAPRPAPRPAARPAERPWWPKEGSPLEDNDILIGLKGGAQFVSYTDVLIDGTEQARGKGTGMFLGGAFFWNLGWPRLEIDAVFHQRAQGGRKAVHYLGIPVLVKFRVTENRLFAWHAGLGAQIDVALTAGQNRRGVLAGLPLATDLLFDFFDGGMLVQFEARYQFGMLTYDGNTTGGRPRDFNLLLGLMFPIDREGF